MQRILAIDVLRGLAITAMIAIHFAENLSPGMPGNAFYETFHMVGELMAAPFFTLLLGFSASISQSKQNITDSDKHSQWNKVKVRALFITLLGFVFAITVWGVEWLFIWDILPFLGIAVLVMYPLRHFKPRSLIFLSLIVILISPLLREFIGFSYAWNETLDTYIPTLDIRQIVIGFFINAFFPFFPWIAFPLAGMALGKAWILRIKNSFSIYQYCIIWGVTLLSIGFGFTGLAKNVNHQNLMTLYITPWTLGYSKYPATTTFILMAIGLFLLLFGLLSFYFDHKRPENPHPLTAPFTLLSKYSLSIYILHHVVHLYPLYLCGLFFYGNRFAFFQQAFSFNIAFLLAIVCVIGLILVATYWEKKKAQWTLEHIMDRLTHKLNTRKEV